jgi:predicted metal-dependent hydrolase
MKFEYYFIIGIIIIIILLYYKSLTYPVIIQKSFIDNQYYTVRNDINKEQAANILANIKHKSITLINKLVKEYPTNKDILRLYKRFNPNNIFETTYKKNYTSYSVNKGEQIYICLRNINKDFENINTIFFVMMHELAHLMTEKYDLNNLHSNIFWNNFKLLEDKAVSYNLYNYVDYSKNPQKYCNTTIFSNP